MIAQEYCYLDPKIQKKSCKSLKLCFEDFEVHAHQAAAGRAQRTAERHFRVPTRK